VLSVRDRSNPLVFLGLVMAVAFVGALVGLALDPRTLTGAPVWLKPAKFGLSTGVYAFTLLWLLRRVTGHARLVRLVGWGTALALAFEMVAIVGQAARGVRSHFNDDTPFDATLFSLMGAAIAVVWLLNLLTALLLLRQPMPRSGFAWGARLGMLVCLLGLLLAAPMIAASSHTVGARDGGPGLPVVGWSTVGGDLRVAHFLALHAMQVLPLAGWAIDRWPHARSAGRRVALVATAAASYAGLMLLVWWQAMRAQPFLAPDATTLTALAVLALATALAAAALVRREGGHRPEVPPHRVRSAARGRVGSWRPSCSSPERTGGPGNGTASSRSCAGAGTTRSRSTCRSATRRPAWPGASTRSSRRSGGGASRCWSPSRWPGSSRRRSASGSWSTCSCC